MPKVKRKALAKSKTSAKPKSSPRTETKPTAKAKGKGAKPGPVYFCDPETPSEGRFLSPWWISNFEVKDIEYQSAGHYIMAEKARAFGDKKALQRILEAETTDELISLGDEIKGVDQRVWRRRVPRIAKNANLHKFTSDDTESRDLLRQLNNLGNRELIFADPSDAILGIGFSAAEAEEVDRQQWGANVFGKSLDTVRSLEKAKTKTPDASKKSRAQGYLPFDTSIFDVGGRLSIYW